MSRVSRVCDFCGGLMGRRTSITEIDGKVRHEHCWGLWLDQKLDASAAGVVRLQEQLSEARAELERLRPVVEAAVSWEYESEGWATEVERRLVEAVATYRARSTDGL